MITTNAVSTKREGGILMASDSPQDHDQQYQTLESEILRFVRKPGETISESFLCQRFGLSRTPVRSLLQRLQSNGLIRIEPKRGSLVTKLDLNIINQLIYERFAVETMVLRDYIATCNPTDVERVRFLYYQMKETAEPYFTQRDAFDTSRFLSADLNMHSEWFRRMNLEYLWQRLSSPQSSYTRFCMLDILSGNNVPDVLSEHEQLLHLIENGNAADIEPLLRRHLYGGIRRLGPHIYTSFVDYFEPFGGDDHAAPKET